MTRRKKILAALATAAGAVAVYLATGTMPAPAPGAIGVRFQARMKCGLAKALAADPARVDCSPGERVYVRVEVATDLASLSDWQSTTPICGINTTLETGLKRAPDKLMTVTGADGVTSTILVTNRTVPKYRCKVDAPKGIRILRKSFRSKSLKYPARTLTVLGNKGSDRCIGGKVRRLTSASGTPITYWRPARGWGICCGAGCECAGARCAAICSPHVYAGDSCDARICRRWPRLSGCGDAGP